ncbi:GNVR domain-containing protein [Roseivirga thermotolerans]|uniref:Chain-length determining protein n=1 Tax=Roseivirga thermotolerans TaxID=1758176 RepID=A0ABQ3I1P2_9BACT|nr:GNVR domain-containing protein [Roseivirga thermotolerans]GHE53537.1 chain-length determining protein [Roseivirga thermotolerans]
MKELNSTNQEIDIINLLALLWQRRKFILKFTLISSVFGLFLALFSANEYQSSSTFVPQTKSETSGSIGGLAALAGINLNSATGANEIPTDLYPRIVSSLPYRLEVLNSNISVHEDTILYGDYLSRRKESVVEKVISYSLGLPGLIIDSFKSETENSDYQKLNYSDSFLLLDNRQNELVKKLEDIITLEYNKKDGYVRLVVTERNPMVAAQLALASVNALQKRITLFKTEMSKNLYDFTVEQWKKRQKELHELQDSLALFNESNQNLKSKFVQNILMRLETRYDVLNSVYIELSSQKEQVALQLEKDTPVFSIIDPVRVPNEKYGPNRTLLLVSCTFVGFVFAVGIVLLRKPFIMTKNRIIEYEK